MKGTFACILFINIVFKLVSLTFGGGGVGGPSTVITGVRPDSQLVHGVRPSLCIPNNGGATPAHTFVGTPRGCEFHPSKVEG